MAAPLNVWLQAIRPRTLGASLVPVCVGLAVARTSGPLDGRVAFLTLLAAVLIQIGTNLANDFYDFLSGADGIDRIGPRRVTQAGLLSPLTVRNAAFAALGLAAIAGLDLVIVGGWPIVAIGAASLLCAVAYTAGPFPLAYRGLGDLFVFVFFGPVAVCGTTYLQTGEWPVEAFVASIPVGALATAILVVNNLRDAPTDRHAGKRTLAVRFGERFARLQYVVLVAAAFGAIGLLAPGPEDAGKLLPLLALPLGVVEVRQVLRRSGIELNHSLAGTARLHVVFGVLLAIGLVL